MEAIKLCRLDTPIIFIEARINLSRFVVTGCAAKSADRKSGSAGMPRPISYAVFCLKKKKDATQSIPAAVCWGDPCGRPLCDDLAREIRSDRPQAPCVRP